MEVKATDTHGTRRPRRHGFPLRWLFVAILLVLSILNYVDRQVLSILATTVQRELGLSDTDYARVGQAFFLCYTLAFLVSGRIVDRWGTRLPEALFATWWSVANMLTGLVGGFGTLALARGLLGLGEPGHFVASVKIIGQWFPARERGMAVGLVAMGGTVGAAIAAPLVAWLTLSYGWRSAFFVTGAVGLVFAAVWWLCYRPPGQHPWLGAKESQLLRDHHLLDAAPDAERPATFREVLGLKPLWVIMAVRCVTDPILFFYLIWFAKFLQEKRGFTLGEVGGKLWMVFLAADIGCVLAGWLGGTLIRRGTEPVRARLRVMCGAAAVMALSFVAPLGGGTWALAWASVLAGCAMLYMACCIALPIDLFSTRSLGSIQGLIGASSSLGGLVSTGLVAAVIGKWSYDAVFISMSFLHPVATLALVLLLPRLTRRA